MSINGNITRLEEQFVQDFLRERYPDGKVEFGMDAFARLAAASIGRRMYDIGLDTGRRQVRQAIRDALDI